MSAASEFLCECGCGKPLKTSFNAYTGERLRYRRGHWPRTEEWKDAAYGTTRRNREIREAVAAGDTLAAVGARYGLSRQRVHQIVRGGR